MSMVNISSRGSFKLKFTAGSLDQVNKLIEEQYKEKITEKAVDTFLKIQPYAERQDVITGGSVFTNASPLGKNIQPFNRYPDARKLKRLYLKAWNSTYMHYRTVHAEANPEQTYARNFWVRHKRQNIGNPSPFLPSRNLKYKSHSLATGYLRQSIFDAFVKSGNEHLQVFNLLVKGGFSWDKSSYSNQGEKYFDFIDIVSKTFEGYGMYSALGGNRDDIVDFFSNDWDDISKMMLQIYKDGPVEDIKNLLNTFTIEV